MDVTNWRKALGIGALCAASFGSPTAYAAQADITVDLNFPSLLIMYHYATIDLDLDQTALGNYLFGACAGGDCTSSEGTRTEPVAAIGAATAVSVDITADAGGLTNSTAEFTLQDAVGVRGLGCTSYAVTVLEDAATSAGVDVDTTSLGDIDGTGCTLALTTGDLVFDVDFTQVSGTTASAVFDVTITSI